MIVVGPSFPARIGGISTRSAARLVERWPGGLEPLHVERLAQRASGDEVTILDIRGAAERDQLRIPGAVQEGARGWEAAGHRVERGPVAEVTASPVAA